MANPQKPGVIQVCVVPAQGGEPIQDEKLIKMIVASAHDPSKFMQAQRTLLQAMTEVMKTVHGDGDETPGVPATDNDRNMVRTTIAFAAYMCGALGSMALRDTVRVNVDVDFGAEGHEDLPTMDQAVAIADGKETHPDFTARNISEEVMADAMAELDEDDDEDFILKTTLPR